MVLLVVPRYSTKCMLYAHFIHFLCFLVDKVYVVGEVRMGYLNKYLLPMILFGNCR